MTHRAEGPNEQEAKDLLDLEKKVHHEEVLIALANEREWARTHPLDLIRKPKNRYFQNDELGVRS